MKTSIRHARFQDADPLLPQEIRHFQVSESAHPPFSQQYQSGIKSKYIQLNEVLDFYVGGNVQLYFYCKSLIFYKSERFVFMTNCLIGITQYTYLALCRVKGEVSFTIKKKERPQ